MIYFMHIYFCNKRAEIFWYKYYIIMYIKIYFQKNIVYNKLQYEIM